MKINGIFLIFVMILSLCCCGAVSAHPGHGTPVEEPSETETGDTDTGTTDTGSTGSTSTGTSSSAYSGSSQASTSSGYTSTSSGSDYSGSGATQSDQTGTTDSQTENTDNNGTTTVNNPEEVTGTSGSSNSPGGPIAIIGLMTVIGLIAMSFPYKEGGTLRNLQVSLFGR
ncbi:MAG: hypothetical protein A4E25_01199 [Methanobacterium sp. PtaB.Bin024]|nr:MAG: hypothetical protein A4E25_01199 [Methanobacterium sp. PtaB.Bin024]